MKDKKKWIIGISACVLLMVSVFFVFNQGKSNEQVVTEYFELLKKKDYKQMYQMLNQKTVLYAFYGWLSTFIIVSSSGFEQQI